MATTSNMATTSEYERLAGHLPLEVEELVKMYAAPIYRNPTHTKCIQSLFGLLKEHAISWILFNESVLEGGSSMWDSQEEQERIGILRRKQIGELCEEEEMDIAIECFVDYLYERDIISINV